MTYWNAWLRESVSDVPPNKVVAAKSVAGGSSDIAYGFGHFDLAPDQALIVETKRPESFDAYDLVLKAMHCMQRLDPDDFAMARALLEGAIEKDPTYAAAHTFLARWYMLNLGQGYSVREHAEKNSFLKAVSRAVDLNPADAHALALLGHCKSWLFRDYDAALDCFERAFAASPNSAFAWGWSSPTCSYLGDGATAVSIRKADGSRLRIDDPDLDPVWEACARLRVPVFIHTADPAEFFREVDYTNERWLELSLFPGRRYPADRFPSFEQLVTERDNLFRKHPNTTFVLAHLGWQGGDLGKPIVVYVTDAGVVTQATGDWRDIELTSPREVTIQVGSPIDEIPNFTWSAN